MVDKRTRNSERGFVLHIYTFMMLFVIVPMVGLAIDAGIMYFLKGKLQAAVDGAALGAARSLNRSQLIASQQTDAANAAVRYYHANFPTGWMGVNTVNDPTVTWPAAPPATAIINVLGQVDAPTWFMRILGFNSVHLAVVGQASRRNVNIMMVIDRSQSLADSGSCPGLVSGAQLFVNSFSNNRDQMALETFGTYYNNDFAFNTNFQPALSNLIGSLNCAGFTNAAAAFSDSYARLKALTQNGALNVLLFFTDGIPNTMTFGPGGTFGTIDQYGTGTRAGLVKTANCTANPANGFSGVVSGDVAYGASLGLAKATDTTYPAANWDGTIVPNNASGFPSTSGCTFPSNYVSTNWRNDFTCLPTLDSFGNSTTGTWPGGAASGFPPSPLNMGSGACANHVLTSSLQNVENAGINALDNAAYNARVDANTNSMPYIVYTIGYGAGINAELLRRVANDPASAVHSTTYTDGKYLAASSSNLANAFAAIAGDILRLSQ